MRMGMEETMLGCMARRLVTLFAIALLTLAGAFAALVNTTPQTAYADEPDATLTLVVQHKQGNTEKAIAGAAFTAYQVAELNEDGYYDLIDPFTKTKVDLNSKMTTREMLAAAKSMASVASAQKVKGTTSTTTAAGKAAFGKLVPGIYLVAQTGATGDATKYATMDSFLINVPQIKDGTVIYDVVASPKPALKAEAKTGPKTGDSLDMSLVAICAVAGILAMAIAIVAARRRRN